MPNEPIEGAVTDISDSVTDAQSGLKSFTLNHPRTAKVVGIAAITAATLGVVSVFKARRMNELENAEEKSDDAYDTSSQTA